MHLGLIVKELDQVEKFLKTGLGAKFNSFFFEYFDKCILLSDIPKKMMISVLITTLALDVGPRFFAYLNSLKEKLSSFSVS